MSFVVIAVWTAEPEETDVVRGILETLTPISRAEEGNLVYQVQVSPDAPNVFVLYEQYTDAAAYEAHKASAAFQKHVVGHALALLESREVKTYETLA